jgi:Cu-Zn family superoxide dismutase
MYRTMLIAVLVLAGAGCSKSGGTAVATLGPSSGTQVTGTATFTEKDGKVEVVIKAKDLSPGKHGVQVHENPDCKSSDASSAGKHFAPGGGVHAGPTDPNRHAGDLGNLEAGADGSGTLTLTTDKLTVSAGERSVVGHSVIVHSEPDDLKTERVPGAGGRIACGVIELQQ